MTPSFLIVALCIGASHGSRKHVREFEIPHVPSKDQLPDSFMRKDLSHTKNHNTVVSDLKEGFSWKDCGTSSALVNIRSLSVGPERLKFPGPVNVSSAFTVAKALNAPLVGQVYAYMWIVFEYFHVKTYRFDDLCSILGRYKDKCPDQLKKIGIDCSCPTAANTYHLTETQLNAPAVSIPSGSYHIKAEISLGGAQAACIEMYFTVA